jgi:hypothetical protein
VNYTIGLPLLQEKNLIELKLIDGIPVNIPIGVPFLYMNKFVKNVKNIQYIIAVSKPKGYNNFE